MYVTPTHFHPRGEASTDGPKPVRVFGGIPGEAAHVLQTGAGQHEIHAQWLNAPVPAISRVLPPCPHYLACGGCPLQHLQAQASRAARQQLIQAALQQEGVDFVVPPVIEGPEETEGYRHFVKLPVAADGRVGAYGRHSHTVQSISGCLALSPLLRTFLEDTLPPPARFLVARASRARGLVLATVVVSETPGPALLKAAMELPADGIWLHQSQATGDAIFDPKGSWQHLSGISSLDELAGDRHLSLGPDNFFQTNPGMAQKLWSHLPRPKGALLDLYCGVGAVSLAIAGADTEIFGVEISERSVQSARENAKRHGLHATFQAMPLDQLCVPASFSGAQVVVNPPRKGLSVALMNTLLQLAPDPLVYISCEPRTLARDLKYLLQGGMKLRQVQGYDMFPHTPHVETVALLDAK